MKRPKFRMALTNSGFELLSGKWPTEPGQLWDGVCVMSDGEERRCQACGSDHGPTFYWD